MNRFLCSISAAILLAPSAALAQINRAKLITTDFTTVEGEITTLNQDGLELIDEQGIPIRVDWDSAWGMSVMMHTESKRLEGKIQDDNMLVFVDTVDGQRVFMTLLDSEDPDFILGSMGPTRVRINLEHVQRIWRIKQQENRDPLEQSSTQPESDRITLVNGDDLTGFVLSIGSTVSIETDTGVVTLPLYQAGSIQIANPPAQRGTPGLYVHTFYGLTFHASRFSMDPQTGKLNMTLMPGIIEYEPESEPVLGDSETNWPGFDLKLAAVEVRHKDKWVSDPLRIGATSYSPTGDRAWTPEPSTYNLTLNTVDAGSIRIHAPSRLETEIDPRSVRLHCEVRPAQLPWTDFAASIDAIDETGHSTTIWSQQLTGRDAPAVVDVPIPANTYKLGFVINPSANGPIQDAGHFAMIRLLVID
jgi:hypothetical protein